MELIIAVDNSNLGVYEKAVLIRIIRRGVCFESQRSMADGLKMSLGKLNATIKVLEKDGWIVRDIDAKTQKMGWAATGKLRDSVTPHEQVQQLERSRHETGVTPHEQKQPDLLHHMNTVLPHERHLKRSSLSFKDKGESQEIRVVNGIPLLEVETPELPEADAVDVEMWAAGLNQIVREGYFPTSGVGKHQDTAQKFRTLANWLIVTYPDLTLDEFERRWTAYWQSTKLQGKPWLSQIESLADEAVSYQPPANKQQVGKQQLANQIWDIVRRYGRSGYHEAMAALNGSSQYVKSIGKWTYVCGLREDEFKVAFYQAYNQVNNHGTTVTA